jgi:hypothetical protein
MLVVQNLQHIPQWLHRYKPKNSIMEQKTPRTPSKRSIYKNDLDLVAALAAVAVAEKGCATAMIGNAERF